MSARALVLSCMRANLRVSGMPDGARLLELQCAGRVTVPLLLRCLAQGVDGVLVLGRYQHICRNFGAEEPARERTELAASLAQMLGLDPRRVCFEAPDPGQSLRLHWR